MHILKMIFCITILFLQIYRIWNEFSFHTMFNEMSCMFVQMYMILNPDVGL